MSVLDAWTSAKCKAMRDRENFLRHVAHGHLDFRRDCSACLAGAARGARHNRRSVHDAWVLHVDLMGPFQEGSDEHGRVRYVLTGILTLPDYTAVSQAAQTSEEIASGDLESGDAAAEGSGSYENSPKGSGFSSPPLSTLGPPVSLRFSPVPEEDLEEYEPSDNEAEPTSAAAREDVMAIQTEDSEPQESEAEARAVTRANDRWIEAAAALQLQACPTIEMPFVRMLPDKSQHTVVQALAAMLSQIQYEGFMVRRLHSDRGREFNNSGVHRLCGQRTIFQTFTQGDDPQQNGRIESFHARLKNKTRTLLKRTDVHLSDWPYAMRTAHAALLTQALRRFGRDVPNPLPFGTQVRVRTRSWERDLWSDRVQDAVVLAPSIETCKGHVVRTASGTLLHTTAVFRGAVQLPPQPSVPLSTVLTACSRDSPIPLSAPPAPEVAVSFPSECAPTHRVRGKQTPDGVKAMRVPVSAREDARALSAAAAALLSMRAVPFRTAAALLVSAPVLRDLAQALPARLGAGESSGYLLFGWYKHGGVTGVSNITTVLPGVVQLLNTLLHQVTSTGSWTTIGLFFSAAAAPHADRRNAKGTCNYVLPLALPPTDQYMWVQRAVRTDLDPLAWLGDDGSVYQGFRLPLVVGQLACVDPHSLHALPTPLPYEAAEDHVLLVGFSVPWTDQATLLEKQQLQSLGFRLESSRGGVGSHDGGTLEPGKFKIEKIEKILATAPQANIAQGEEPGLLEWCVMEEGHHQLRSENQVAQLSCAQDDPTRESGYDPQANVDINEDLQPDSFAEGSKGISEVQRQRLQGRHFEPRDRNAVRDCLRHLGLMHLAEPVEQLGVEALEDFLLLFREDLIEAGASKVEAERILEYVNGGELEGDEVGPEPTCNDQVDQRLLAGRLRV